MTMARESLCALALSLLLLTPVAATPSSPTKFGPWPVPRTSPCLPGEVPRPVDLPELWRLGGEGEPGYIAIEESIGAEQASRTSIRREWIPSFSLTGVGNYGQRLSPGEERILGVGPRGEMRLLGAWTLMESDRMRRGDVGDQRIREALAAGHSFEVVHRGHLARVYVDAAVAEELRDLHDDHVARLAELAEPVRQRLESGVDASWETYLLDEAVSRTERLLAGIDQLRSSLRNELAMLTGSCVRAAPYAPRLDEAASESGAEANPDVLLLRVQADTREAMARQERDRGSWQLQVIGTLGPNHSRAFDSGPWRNEYLVGLAGSVNLDLGGVRRQLAASESARARAIDAEAESLRLALERELARTRIELDHMMIRRAGLEIELVQAQTREEIALLRWREGIDRWTEVMTARDRVLELRILEIELHREMAVALIRHGEVTGDIDDLPALLGQESDL